MNNSTLQAGKRQLSIFEAKRLWDAIVVGAGPAGSIAAIKLARSGLDVLLVDKSSFPRAKVCGCCLNRTALNSLESLHLIDRLKALEPAELSQLQLCVGHVKAHIDLPRSVSVSRQSFDAALVGAATSEGVSFLPAAQAKVGGIYGDRRMVTLRIGEYEVSPKAKVVVVADGLSGTSLTSTDGFECEIVRNSRIGAGTILKTAPEAYKSGMIYMAIGKKGYAGFVRLEDGTLDLAAALDLDFVKQCGGPAQAVKAIMHESHMTYIPGLSHATWRATPALTRKRRRLAQERVFVIGDSASYVEPFTGEGMAWAIATGVAVEKYASAAASQWDDSLISKWEAHYEKTIGRKQKTSRLLGNLLRYPMFTHPAVSLLTKTAFIAAAAARGISSMDI